MTLSWLFGMRAYFGKIGLCLLLHNKLSSGSQTVTIQNSLLHVRFVLFLSPLFFQARFSFLFFFFFFLRNDLITVTHAHLQTATGSSTPAFGVKGSSVAVVSTTEQVHGWKWKSQYQYSSSFGSLLKCIHSNSCLSLVIWSFLLSQHSIG